MLQTLGMPEAARHASAELSLTPDHAALRSGDVGATLQQQQRLTTAIRAGTAMLHLDEHPGINVGALALSGDLSKWATISQSGQSMTVTVHSWQGVVCQHALAGSRVISGVPVFNHDNSRVGVPFTTPTAPSKHACSVALISLAQPAQQPLVVETSSSLHSSHLHCIAAAPSADLFVVCTHKANMDLAKSMHLSTLSGEGSYFQRHEAPKGAFAPAGDQQLFSPDSRFLCLLGAGEVHCLELCHGIWHSLQRPSSSYLDPIWLPLPACHAQAASEREGQLGPRHGPALDNLSCPAPP